MKKEIIDYSKDYEAYCELVINIRKACICNIKAYMNILKTEILELSGSDAYDDYARNHNYLCIGYDGGNHPEYASNMFSEVSSIEVNNNTITIHTKDGSMEEGYLLLDELVDIEGYLKWYSNEWLPENGKEYS